MFGPSSGPSPLLPQPTKKGNNCSKYRVIASHRQLAHNIIMHRPQGPKGRGVADRQQGVAFVFLRNLYTVFESSYI